MTPNIATLKALYAEKHPWMQFVEGFSTGGYGTYGGLHQWQTLMWWATGDDSWARKAIDNLLPAIRASRDTSDRNSTRESSFYWALEYMWLEERMTAREREEYRAFLSQWADSMLGQGNQGIFTLPEDSDEVVGHYMGLRLIDKAIGTQYEHVIPGGSSIGAAQMRQRITDFCRMADGGEWIESSEYNLGTLQLLIIGAHFVGMDEFPEVQALLPQIAEQLCWTLTPDLKDSVQWGDEQSPHDLHLNNRVALMAILCGLGYGGGKLRNTLEKLVRGKDVYPHFWMNAYRALWFFDPRTLESFVSDEPPPAGLRVSPGQGLCIYRTADTLLQVQMQPPPKPTYTDHCLMNFGNVRLWHNGEWVLSHPIGYGAWPSAHNVCLLGGLGVMDERWLLSADAYGFGCSIIGRVMGARHDTLKEIAFVESWLRTVDFDDKGTLHVIDSFSGREPFSIERYSDADRAQINARLGLWVQLWHAPVEPISTGDGYTWTTPGGQPVTLTTNAKLMQARPEKVGDIVHDPASTLHGSFHDSQSTGWQIAFISNEPTAVIETTITIGDEVIPEPEPPAVTLESRVAALEQVIERLINAAKAALE